MLSISEKGCRSFLDRGAWRGVSAFLGRGLRFFGDECHVLLERGGGFLFGKGMLSIFGKGCWAFLEMGVWAFWRSLVLWLAVAVAVVTRVLPSIPGCWQ